MIDLKRIVFLFALLATITACSDRTDEPDSPNKAGKYIERFSLRLNVAVNSAGDSRASRADKSDGDGYEPFAHSGFEQVTTLRVIILDPDDNTVKGNRMVQMNLVEGKLVPVNDNLIFSVKSGETLLIYLIANESSLPLPASVDAASYPTVSQWLDRHLVNSYYENLRSTLNSWTAGYAAAGEVSGSLFNTGEGSYLPLTERFSFLVDQSKAVLISSEGNETDGSLIAEYMQEATLFLTPAAAKVTYAFDFSALNQNVSGVNVTGVRLNGLGQTEYVFPTLVDGNTLGAAVYKPQKYSSAGVVNEVKDDERYITSFSVPAGGVVNFTLSGDKFTPVEMKKASDGVERGPYYFAETLSSRAQNAFTVQVQIDGGEWLTAQPLQDNILEIIKDGNTRQGIARATHLRITIRFSELGITWQAIEAPYNSVILKPSFGDPYIPTRTGN